MFCEIKNKDEKYVIQSYGRFDIAFERGEGATLFDVENKEYVDFGSGIGTSSLGYQNKNWTDAVLMQTKKLAHTSNLFYHQNYADVAEILCEKSGMKRAFFGNSGAEANECAIKLARKYSFLKYGAEKNRNKIITLKNSFHGRTITTLSATGQDVFHNYFFPFTEGFDFASPDLNEIESKTDDKVCAFMIELIQGEGGVLALDKDFVQELFDFAAKKDILIIIDEVQTGIARTGSFMCFEQYGVNPDIVSLAKGLGGGLPIGVCLVNKKLEKTFTFGDHGSTFGANPIACAGAKAVLETVTEKGFCEEVIAKGEFLKQLLLGNLGEYIKEIRGKGLMLGVELKEGLNAKDLAKKAIEFGTIVLTAKTALRFLPPLVITEKEMEKGIFGLKKAADSIFKGEQQ